MTNHLTYVSLIAGLVNRFIPTRYLLREVYY